MVPGAASGEFKPIMHCSGVYTRWLFISGQIMPAIEVNELDQPLHN